MQARCAILTLATFTHDQGAGIPKDADPLSSTGLAAAGYGRLIPACPHRLHRHRLPARTPPQQHAAADEGRTQAAQA